MGFAEKIGGGGKRIQVGDYVAVQIKTTVDFDAFTLFLKGVTILTPYTSVRNSLQAIDLLKNKRIDMNSLISHRLSITEFEHGVNLINIKQENVKKVIIIPSK